MPTDAAVACRAGATPGERAATTRIAVEIVEREEADALGVSLEDYRKAQAEGRDLRYEAEQADKGLLRVADIFAPLPPINWLCQALEMAPGAPTIIAGYGYSGKTVAAQDLALAVASEALAWGSFRVRSGRVLHLDYEQGRHLTCLRYQRLARARGIDPATIADRLVVEPLPGWYLDSDAADTLARRCRGFDLVIVDSFRAACPHTEENASEARIPLDRLGRISSQTGATMLALLHARKPSENSKGGARMAVRGSSALYDACTSMLVFGGEKGEPVSVVHEKGRITGQTHEDFRLWIEDVEIDGDPKAGLRVSVMDGTPVAQQGGAERLRDLQGRVLAFVEAQGGTTGGNNVIAEHLGGRRQTLNAAIAELVRAGRLHRGGTSKEPTLHLTGTT